VEARLLSDRDIFVRFGFLAAFPLSAFTLAAWIFPAAN